MDWEEKSFESEAIELVETKPPSGAHPPARPEVQLGHSAFYSLLPEFQRTLYIFQPFSVGDNGEPTALKNLISLTADITPDHSSIFMASI